MTSRATRTRRVAKDEEITMNIPLDERLVESATAALEMYGVHLGRALGLYAALADRGPLTAVRAGRRGRHRRPLRPRVAGTAGGVGLPRRRRAEPARRAAPLRAARRPRRRLVDVDDPAHVAPLADMVAGIGQCFPRSSRPTARSRCALPQVRRGLPARPGWCQSAGLHARPHRILAARHARPARGAGPARGPDRRPRVRPRLLQHRAGQGLPGRRGGGDRLGPAVDRRGP